jgi:hypothetical protein
MALGHLGIFDPDAVSHSPLGTGWEAVSLLLAAVPTWSVWRASRPAHTQAPDKNSPPVRSTMVQEYAGDALLWVSVTIITRVLWGGLYDLVAPSAGIGLGRRSIMLPSALSILSVVFNRPSRYLFLEEDGRHPGT